MTTASQTFDLEQFCGCLCMTATGERFRGHGFCDGDTIIYRPDASPKDWGFAVVMKAKKPTLVQVVEEGSDLLCRASTGGGWVQLANFRVLGRVEAIVRKL